MDIWRNLGALAALAFNDHIMGVGIETAVGILNRFFAVLMHLVLLYNPAQYTCARCHYLQDHTSASMSDHAFQLSLQMPQVLHEAAERLTQCQLQDGGKRAWLVIELDRYSSKLPAGTSTQ